MTALKARIQVHQYLMSKLIKLGANRHAASEQAKEMMQSYTTAQIVRMATILRYY